MKTNFYKVFLTSLTCLLGILVVFVFSYYKKDAKLCIINEHSRVLEEAVILNAKRKTSKIHIVGSFNSQSGKIGTYETRIFRDKDTTFQYQSKIVDIETDLIRSGQSYLLYTHDLHSNDIEILFDSLIQQKGIYIYTAIGITDSCYLKLNDWSCDTTQFKATIKSSFTKQGDFEDINYHAYSEIKFLSIWKLMPKALIVTLFSMALFSGLLLIYVSKKKNKEDNIITLNENLDIFPEEKKRDFFCAEKLTIDDKRLIGGKKEVKLSQQLQELLNMFLDSENYRVNKENIKKTFWPHNDNALTNMTTTIDRLKKRLMDAECGWTINTDVNNDNFYVLEPKESIEATDIINVT